MRRLSQSSEISSDCAPPAPPPLPSPGATSARAASVVPPLSLPAPLRASRFTVPVMLMVLPRTLRREEPPP